MRNKNLRYLLAAAAAALFLAANLGAEQIKAVNMQQFWNLKPKPVEKTVEKKKAKAELKLDMDALRKKVVKRPNGDIFTPEFPTTKKLAPSLPHNLDSLIAFYFPWTDVAEVEEAVNKVHNDRTIANTPQRDIEAVNRVLGKNAARLLSITPSLGNIKQKIEDGKTLYWICDNDDNFFMFASLRSDTRKGASSIAKWKNELAKNNYPSLKFKPWDGVGYYLVVSVNAESGEVGLAPTNNRSSVIYITMTEMKKLHQMLLEPSW